MNSCICGHSPIYHKQKLFSCVASVFGRPSCSCTGYRPALHHWGQVNIVAIDPSWTTGVAMIELNLGDNPWIHRPGQTEKVSIFSTRVIDVHKLVEESAQTKISKVVGQLGVILGQSGFPVDIMAIELPFSGIARSGGVADPRRSFRSKDSINQGRLFQALADYAIELGVYDPGASEVHQAQAKSAVVSGIGVKKEVAQQAARSIYGLDEYLPKANKAHREAMIDAILVGLGCIKLRHKQIQLPKIS